jgi:membrane-bound ClpP family serine protease
MQLDIRLPIGLMFGLEGLILFVYGLISDHAKYSKSLGIDVNLWWGLVMIIFAAVMLLLSFLAAKAAAKEEHLQTK